MAPRNRGIKQQKLHTYSRLAPTEDERKKIVDSFGSENTPIVVAILGQNILEIWLDELLRTSFRRQDDLTWSALLDNTGPLSSFHQKIQIAFALGTVNEVTKSNLNKVRNIRNAFAHSKKPLTFDNPAVVKELTTLVLPNGSRTKLFKNLLTVTAIASVNPQQAYRSLCWILGGILLDRLKERIKASHRRLLKKHEKEQRQMLRQGLLGYIQEPPLGLLSSLPENLVAVPDTALSLTNPSDSEKPRSKKVGKMD